MILVDSDVFVYAVGRAHPLREEAQGFFLQSSHEGKRLVTSAAVLQELVHIYLPLERMQTLDAALDLATLGVDHVIPVGAEAVIHARHLVDKHPGLTARDLLHLAICHIENIKELKTFDRNLLAALGKT
ncbi:MAG: type II toxin-antitoxin system VapC family toxin [Thermodesulfobacteriota bacterium]|nr:type II toxin-antitoxin system VapC family toxin [Thermodesulfobacteriota bacterium]